MANFRLNDADLAFVEERIRTGRNSDVDEVIHAGLQALRESETSLEDLIREAEDDIAAGRIYEFGENDSLTDFIVARSKARKA